MEEKYREASDKLKELDSSEREYLSLLGVNEEELDRREEEIATINHEIEEVSAKIQQLSSRLGGLTREDIGKAEKELRDLEWALSELIRKKGRVEQISERIESLLKQRDELRKEIEDLSFDQLELDRKRKDRDALRVQIETLQRDIGEKRGKLHEIIERRKQLESEITELTEKVKQVQDLSRAKERLEKLRRILSEGGLQSYLISTLKGRIENNLNDIMSMFNMSFARVILTFQESRSLSGKIDIQALDQNGQSLPIGMLSGGEKIAIALGLRLAIARSLMGSLGFMILDEPTIHLDSQRRAELLSVIQESMRVVPQIIVVTHDEEVLRIAEYVIRVEKVGGKSEVIEGVNQ
ncbi:AAA family ATPase [Metallosphaera hakonensis]|uniref:AAA family ATPase n=1 Tax=Metallosphaera hakonensis TaxID=79601 RepID=UPI0006D0E846|nr:SMC family ATPase [Metallosphaera hakonensis]